MAGRPRRRARRNPKKGSVKGSWWETRIIPQEDSWLEGQEGVVAHESGSVYVDEDGDRWALAWVRLPWSMGMLRSRDSP